MDKLQALAIVLKLDKVLYLKCPNLAVVFEKTFVRFLNSKNAIFYIFWTGFPKNVKNVNTWDFSRSNWVDKLSDSDSGSDSEWINSYWANWPGQR